MFILDVDMPPMTSALIECGCNVISDIKMWHEKIRHINMRTLKNALRRNAISGLPHLKVCMVCKVLESC